MSDDAIVLRPKSWRRSERVPSPLVVEPVTPVIGAEIWGVDLRRPLEPETIEEIRDAIARWRVIFFCEQDISNDQLKTFGRYFGPLTPAHPIARGLDDHPEIWERAIDEYRRRWTRGESRPIGARPPRDDKGWHVDITFVANPNRYSILHGVRIPPYGGDTLFTNLVAAYDGLSPKIRALIDELQAVHQASARDFDRPKDGHGADRYVSLHPLVRLHPETGERVLFFNASTVSHIAGLKEPESRFLIDLLFHEITRPQYQMRFRWSPKALVVWDNAAVSHAGPIDYAQFDLPRVVRRITVAGDLPEGPGGFRSQAIEGALFNVLG